MKRVIRWTVRLVLLTGCAAGTLNAIPLGAAEPSPASDGWRPKWVEKSTGEPAATPAQVSHATAATKRPATPPPARAIEQVNYEEPTEPELMPVSDAAMEEVPSADDYWHRQARHEARHGVRAVSYEWGPSRDPSQQPTPARRPGYTRPSPRMATRSLDQYELPPGRVAPQPTPAAPMGPEEIGEGEIFYDQGSDGPYPESMDGEWSDGGFVDGGMMEGDFGGDCEDCGHAGGGGCCPHCGSCVGYIPGYDGWHDCGHPGCIGPCSPYHWFDEAYIALGVHGFKNPIDQGLNGNFGFNETINFAGSLWWRHKLGYQVGGQFLQSNLSGSNAFGTDEESRDTAFLTAGLFHRPFDGHGWQGGIVYDYMEDQYVATLRFAQLRYEISYLTACCHEIGFWGTAGVGSGQEAEINNQDFVFEVNDIYTFFYRYNGPIGGQGRIFAGFSGRRDGVLGVDYRVPLNNRFELIGGATYIIPKEGQGDNGFSEETWSLTMNLAWYPMRSKCGVHKGPFRSLFNVADFNSMIVTRVDE